MHLQRYTLNAHAFRKAQTVWYNPRRYLEALREAFALAATLLLCLPVASGQAKILTNDPLTGLPLLPPTESNKTFGNAPDKQPDSAVCKSKMQGDFDSFFNFSNNSVKLTDAVAFYASRLSGFKKVAATNNAQTVFYNSDGTLLVIVSSQTDAKDSVAKVLNVAYQRYQPGLSEKTIVGVTQHEVVCQ